MKITYSDKTGGVKIALNDLERRQLFSLTAESVAGLILGGIESAMEITSKRNKSAKAEAQRGKG